jgi:SAM-dependent methyltransferase
MPLSFLFALEFERSSQMHSSASLKDMWPEWPQWSDEQTFRTPNLTFVSIANGNDTDPYSDGRIPVHKPRGLLDLYRDLLHGQNVRSIAEIGYLYGGMVLFLADMIPTAKVVGMDRAQVPPAALEIASKHNLSNRARYHGGVWQDESKVVRGVLEQEFGTEPLDLIVDDASHFYQESKSTFETCFGYLRPGGRYILEDWGWAHWSDPKWQTGQNYLSGTTPLSKLVFELTMLLASRPGILSRLEIMNGSCVVATRGDELPYRAPISLDSTYLTAGRRFVAFAGSGGPEQETAAARDSDAAKTSERTAKKALLKQRARANELKEKLAMARESAAKWRKEYKRISSSRTWKAWSRLNKRLKTARDSMLGRSGGTSHQKDTP